MYMILLDALLVWRRGKAVQHNSKSNTKSTKCVCTQKSVGWHIFERKGRNVPQRNFSQARACLHTKHGTNTMPVWTFSVFCDLFFSFLNVEFLALGSKRQHRHFYLWQDKAGIKFSIRLEKVLNAKEEHQSEGFKTLNVLFSKLFLPQKWILIAILIEGPLKYHLF